MLCKHLSKTDFQIGHWAGGTTAQLYIYPENSDYKTKDFEFRISTASVDLEESDFTLLTGVSRQIMTLMGDIKLTHEDKEPIVLTPWQVHFFPGDLATRCKGKCTDFNLMTTGSTKAEVSHWRISEENSVCFIPEQGICKAFFYLYKGNAQFIMPTGSVIMQSGEFLSVEDLNSEEISIISDCEALIAAVYVWG